MNKYSEFTAYALTILYNNMGVFHHTLDSIENALEVIFNIA